VNHIIDFNTVDKLGVVSHLCLDSIKLGVELLQVGESPQMHSLHIVPNVLVTEEEFNDLMAKLYFLDISRGLFEPLF